MSKPFPFLQQNALYSRAFLPVSFPFLYFYSFSVIYTLENRGLDILGYMRSLTETYFSPLSLPQSRKFLISNPLIDPQQGQSHSTQKSLPRSTPIVRQYLPSFSPSALYKCPFQLSEGQSSHPAITEYLHKDEEYEKRYASSNIASTINK